jgi:hypothetical protein
MLSLEVTGPGGSLSTHNHQMHQPKICQEGRGTYEKNFSLIFGVIVLSNFNKLKMPSPNNESSQFFA